MNLDSFMWFIEGLAQVRSDSEHLEMVRAKKLSLCLAERLGLPGDLVEKVGLAAGLMNIALLPAEFSLAKKGMLRPKEQERIMEHPATGGEVIGRVPELKAIGLDVIVTTHHERFDGSGYPDGLKGSSIPLEARIVSIVDVYVAQTSPRPFREHELSNPEALEEIRRAGESGKLDPAIVPVFLEMMQGIE